MHNQLSWPPLRTDIMALICVGIAIASLATGRWPVLAVLALVGAIFCAISPRMKGPFGFQGGAGTQIGGTFDDGSRPTVILGRATSESTPEPQPRN